jgi:hypothetical protein
LRRRPPAARRRAGAPSLAAALAVALAAALAAGCTARSEGSERLEATAPAWILAGTPLEIRVVTRGSIARRPVSIVVTANADVIGSFDTIDGIARAPVPARELRAGRNRFAIKTGSERTSLEIWVVPWWAAAAPLALLAFAAGLYARRRRRAA